MRTGVIPAITSLVCVCLAQPALADVLQIPASKDNTLYEDAGGALSNGSGDYLFMGKTGSLQGKLLRRALVEFDLSALPGNALINSAQVSFTIDRAPDAALPNSAALHALNVEWGEGASNAPGAEGGGTTAQSGDATWLNTFWDTADWALPGGDYVASPSATTSFGNSDSETMIFSSTPQLVADVQNWVRNPAANHGWILRGDEVASENARRMISREHGSMPAPTLEIDFNVPLVTDNLVLTQIASGLANPIGIVNAGDGTGRLFIIEQRGEILIYDPASGEVLETPFLDIKDDVFSLEDPADGNNQRGGNEQGLLGLAFHPDYVNEKRFFVNYTINPEENVWHTVVVEYMVSGDPDVAMTVGEVLLEFEQEAKNHNGGDLHFGPDGYLYIASGDGGGSGDTYDNAQNIDSLRGAMLRIDVDGVAPEGAELCGILNNHGIPAGNAFPGSDDGCDEILHIGLRNPWRFSFDAASGDLWIADVGQNDWEEVNMVTAGAADLNFGWPCLEGTHDYSPGAGCPAPLTAPVFEYEHLDGNCSVTGGYLYRGSRLPIGGRYIYGDYCSARVWVAQQQDGVWNSVEWQSKGAALQTLSSFGQGENCELYITDRQAGRVYLIEDSDHLFQAGFEQNSCR